MPVGPLVRVSLPDGQTIMAVAVNRTRDRHGTWWYELEVTLLARVDRPPAPARAEPFSVRFTPPYPVVQPVEGQNYDGLPATHEDRLRWPLTTAYSTEGSVTVVHRSDCHEARHAHRRLTDDAAADLLRGRDAAGCPVCRPDRVLLRH